jgi:hypothetical protein
VPTAAEEQEEEDSSQASLELIQQTRKPEFSAPGTVQAQNTHSVVFYCYCIFGRLLRMVGPFLRLSSNNFFYVKLIGDAKTVVKVSRVLFVMFSQNSYLSS